MNNRKQFDKTIGILVKAYFNETLEHGEPCACAVGNLILANGIKPSWVWYNAVRRYSNPCEESNLQIESTGYSIEEIRSIEYAFEFRQLGIEGSIEMGRKDKDGYLGLMRVVDVLIEIHEGTEQEAKEAKALFETTR